MYGIVLATALTVGGGTADHWGHGCWGCHGCYGCSGCYGCYGCCGCWGGYAVAWGGYGISCLGCYGYSYGCWGCYGGCCGCYGGCWGCYGGCCGCCGYGWGWGYGCWGCCGCYGCCGYVASAAPVVVPSGSPAAPTEMPKAKEGDKAGTLRPATVVVKAPSDVTLTVNGQATPRRAEEEAYLTPDLTVGKSYTYEFKAEAVRDGKKVTRTERINVRPGETTRIDFSRFDRAVATAEAGKVTVVLPAGAKLYVNNIPVPAQGRETFETPKLEKGKKFFYTVKVEMTRDGRSVSETKRVSVEAGKSVTVDFTATLTASR